MKLLMRAPDCPPYCCAVGSTVTKWYATTMTMTSRPSQLCGVVVGWAGGRRACGGWRARACAHAPMQAWRARAYTHAPTPPLEPPLNHNAPPPPQPPPTVNTPSCSSASIFNQTGLGGQPPHPPPTGPVPLRPGGGWGRAGCCAGGERPLPLHPLSLASTPGRTHQQVCGSSTQACACVCTQAPVPMPRAVPPSATLHATHAHTRACTHAHACTHPHTRARTRAHTSTHAHTHAHACMHPHTRIRMRTQIHMHAHNTRTRASYSHAPRHAP